MSGRPIWAWPWERSAGRHPPKRPTSFCWSISSTGSYRRFAQNVKITERTTVTKTPDLIDTLADCAPPVCTENQIRQYWWCSPPRAGREMIMPTLSIARWIGASLFRERCVLNFRHSSARSIAGSAVTPGDDMVGTLAADRSDQSFGETVLPRRACGMGLSRMLSLPKILSGEGLARRGRIVA